MKEKIEDFSRALRTAHRRFLENERKLAEQYFGRALGNFEYLQLLMTDKNFEWMRPLSTMMADIDEFAHEAKVVTASDLARIRAKVEEVLHLEEPVSMLSKRYQTHLNEDPEFAVLHANVAMALNELAPKKNMH